MDKTQEQLALALDVNPNTISRYETDATAVPRVVELAVRQLQSEFEAGERNGGDKQWQ